jgi:hypothetical protein
MVAFVATGRTPVFLELSLIFSMLVGAGALGPNALRLPAWARRREAQMEEVAQRARELIKAPDSGESPPDQHAV